MLLQEHRQQKKLSQSEVAKKIGVSTRYYRSVELGNAFPRQKVLNALEDLFEKPQRVLLAKNAEEVPNYMKKHL